MGVKSNKNVFENHKVTLCKFKFRFDYWLYAVGTAAVGGSCAIKILEGTIF